MLLLRSSCRVSGVSDPYTYSHLGFSAAIETRTDPRLASGHMSQFGGCRVAGVRVWTHVNWDWRVAAALVSVA
jgi:hypothetical protein